MDYSAVKTVEKQCLESYDYVSDLGYDYVSDRLTINISGAIYQTRQRTLARYPQSLLGDPLQRQKYYCPKIDAYFFNRHRRAFESILFYYQSGGRLVLPKDVPIRLFFEEVEFFGLGDEALCLVSKGLYAGKQEQTSQKLMPTQPLQRKIWETFEFPDSSSFAKALSAFCIVMIVLSIILSCLSTSIDLQEKHCTVTCPAASNLNVTTKLTGSTQMCCDSYKPIKAVVVLDLICHCWFLLEYFCRLASSPSKKQFLLSFLNFIDFIVVVPFLITSFINIERTNSFPGFRLVRILRLLRLARIIKLSRYSRGLKALGSTLRASFRELKMMIMFLSMVIVISSCTVYMFEMKNPEALIKSIPDGFWWSVTTITTVGYGDFYPVSEGGKFIGCLCAVLGALAFSLPVIVFAANFRTCYKSDDSITAEYHRNLRRRGTYGRW